MANEPQNQRNPIGLAATTRALLNAFTDRALLLDVKGNILALNPVAARAFGSRPEHLIGVNAFDLGDETVSLRRRARHQEVVRTGRPVRYEDVRDGRWLDTRLYPIQDASGKVYQVAVFSQDITEFRETEAELQRHRNELEALVEERTREIRLARDRLEKEIRERKEAEKRLIHEKTWLEALVYNSDLAIVTVDAVHRVTSCNRNFVRLFQYELHEIAGKNLDDVVARDQARQEAGAYTSTTIAGKAIKGEGRRRRRDGTLVDVEIFGIPVTVEGEVVGAYGIYLNITDRKRAQEAQRASESRLRAILAANPDPVVVYDIKGYPQYLNPAFTRVFGWTLESLRGGRIPFVPADQDEVTGQKIRELYETGNPVRLETRRLTRDGKVLDIFLSAAGIKDDTGMPVGMVVDLTDITEKNRVHTQLIRAQKMEAIGSLASGVAHDFNNLLMGIQGRASLMAMGIRPGHPLQEHILGIEEYVRKAAGLTKQLLSFSRGGRYEVALTDFNGLIRKSAAMFGRTKKEVTIHIREQADLWTVNIDQGQLEQVLLNLFVNAWQAMPGGGNLHIQTENVELGAEDVRTLELAPGRYVRTTIRDEGIGMDRETLDKIFDPFFTTKETMGGTGLGLASAYGIMKAHGGFIEVSSQMGRGAAFFLYLPAAFGLNAVEQAWPADETVSKGQGAILLVDDEPMILEVGKQILQSLGYTVLSASGGRMAVETYRKQGGEIDLVILDMIMPDQSGGKTYDLLKEINPKVKVLLSSGYSVDGEAQQILNRGCSGFIQKPFTAGELSQKIKEILGSTDPQEI